MSASSSIRAEFVLQSAQRNIGNTPHPTAQHRAAQHRRSQGGAIVVSLFNQDLVAVAAPAPGVYKTPWGFCAPAPPLAAQLARVAGSHVHAAPLAAAHARATNRAKAAPPGIEHGIRKLQLHAAHVTSSSHATRPLNIPVWGIAAIELGACRCHSAASGYVALPDLLYRQPLNSRSSPDPCPNYLQSGRPAHIILQTPYLGTVG